MKPQIQTEDKRFFHKAFRNIKSLLIKGYAKLPKNPLLNPIFSGSSKIGPKLQETDSSCISSSQRWDDPNTKADPLSVKGDGQSSKCSKSASDQRLDDLKEEKSSFLATEKFAQKMERLERMNVDDGDHVMDIDEVVQCYSLLKSPAYLEIVNKFSMDVYRELNLPQPSRNVENTMRKLDSLRRVGAASIHSSSRKVGLTEVQRSIRRMGCSTSVDISMRENPHTSNKKLNSTTFQSSKTRLDSDSLRRSMRKLGSDSLHGSMRKLGSDSTHGSMRKLGSDSIHGSMRKLGGPDSIHGSMRKLSGPDSVHGSMRKLGGSNSVYGSMRKLGGSDSVYGSMRKLGGSDSVYGSMRCMPSKAIWG